MLDRPPEKDSKISYSSRIFLPKSQTDTDAEAEAASARKAGLASIERWSLEMVPEDIRGAASVNVQEVQCGDPSCSPVDVAVVLQFPKSADQGMFGLPMEAKDVTRDILGDTFPDEDTQRKWHAGETAEWPPYDEGESDIDEDGLPNLRFDVGTKVECRMGPDPKTGWAKGEIVKLWYREKNWPPSSTAPYQVELDDDRVIFAPGDMDQIIRKAQN